MIQLPSNERWIKDAEGMYSVSYEGEVYSYRGNGKLQMAGGKVKCKKTGKIKLRNVCLVINGQNKTINYQKLVADAWLPNPDNLPNVFHMDFDKMNNSVPNLKRVSAQEQTILVYEEKHCEMNQTRNENKGFSNDQDLVEFIKTGNMGKFKIMKSLKIKLTEAHFLDAGVPYEMLGCVTRSSSYLKHWNYIITLLDYCDNSDYNLSQIAYRFNIDQSMVSLIRNGKRWVKERNVYNKFRVMGLYLENYAKTYTL